MDYDSIKKLARQRGVNKDTLIALAPANDPFYTGTPADKRVGQWFADLWHSFNFTRGVHIRRMHYRLVTAEKVYCFPDGYEVKTKVKLRDGTIVMDDNGKPVLRDNVYRNDLTSWGLLTKAAKMARYLGLLDVDAFVDKRNPEPKIFAAEKSEWGGTVGIVTEVESGSFSSLAWDFPTMPSLPSISVSLIPQPKDYLVEVWVEKSTMEDELLPVCQRYGANYVDGKGEMSITAANDLLRRAADLELPARILYISDFDPGGRSMPVGLARKVEFLVKDFPGVDVTVEPIALLPEQIREYKLPGIPLKDSEARGNKFTDQWGEDSACELDALEALHPGELAKIVTRHIERYRDDTWQPNANKILREAHAHYSNIAQSVLDDNNADIDAANDEFDRIIDDASSALEQWSEETRELWRSMGKEIQKRKREDGAKWDVPKPEYPDADSTAPLFDTGREYLDQMTHYKTWQAPPKRDNEC